MKINNIESYSPIYMGNNNLLYVGDIGHNKFLFSQSLRSTSTRKQLKPFNFLNVCYAGTNRIAYLQKNIGLYVMNLLTLESSMLVKGRLENIFYAGYSRVGYSRILSSGESLDVEIIDINTGSTLYFPNTSSSATCYIGENRLVYSNSFDLSKLYYKSLIDQKVRRLTSIFAIVACYVGDDYITYHNYELSRRRLFLKHINDMTEGIDLNLGSVDSCCAVGKGELVYSSSQDNNLYYVNLKEFINKYENSRIKK